MVDHREVSMWRGLLLRQLPLFHLCYSEYARAYLRRAFEGHVLEWPQVTTKKMFGCPCYQAKGKLFAFFSHTRHCNNRARDARSKTFIGITHDILVQSWKKNCATLATAQHKGGRSGKCHTFCEKKLRASTLKVMNDARSTPTPGPIVLIALAIRVRVIDNFISTKHELGKRE